ncbi:MAG: hypothetical protein NC311_09865 [Muribaculaceae bacterium]|nr:hypothetical protein [Muribaculaceae bacterium]
MLSGFTRNLVKVPLYNNKLPEFWYCTYEFNGDIHELLADELIKNNKILSYMRDNNQETLAFLKANLEDKLRSLKNSATGTKSGNVKNDGVYMNFLSFEALKEFHDVLPLYLLQRSDIEKPKFGIDAVFYNDDNLWIFEFKTSTSKLNERSTAKKIYDGVESLFCSGEFKSASIFDCRSNIRENNLNPKLLGVTQCFIDDRDNIEKLLNNPNLKFNVCIVSPSGEFTQEDIINYIHKEYLDCENCTVAGKSCGAYSCPRYEKIKIFNAFHVQLPTNFSLEKLYDELIEKIGGSNNG